MKPDADKLSDSSHIAQDVRRSVGNQICIIYILITELRKPCCYEELE